MKADPNDATANNDLGYLLADQGKRLPEAERLIRKALELDSHEKRSAGHAGVPDSDNAAYIDSLGWVLFRRGQWQSARQCLEKAVTLPDGEDDPTVWDHLGDVCFRMRDTERARNAWQRARALFELEKRRKPDEHYKELQLKLRLLNMESRKP